MNFITFLREEIDHQYGQRDVDAFYDFAINDETFPNSSDPVKLAKYLYLKLTPQETLGYQKFFGIYTQICTSNQVPPKCKNDKEYFLRAINYIVKLQNNDPNYPFRDLIPHQN